MFSASTYVAIVAQVARLVRSPSARLASRHGPVPPPSVDGCGCCPMCGAFVFVEFAEVEGATLCPRCLQPIESLDPLGSA